MREDFLHGRDVQDELDLVDVDGATEGGFGVAQPGEDAIIQSCAIPATACAVREAMALARGAERATAVLEQRLFGLCALAAAPGSLARGGSGRAVSVVHA